jgi:gamma-glutamylputrescine oxidase
MMTFSHWQRPHSFSVPGFTTDVLIIGGGFVGLSTAFWISELNPGTKITVLERRQCGEGASGRNAGFLTKGSAAFFRDLHAQYGIEKSKDILNFADTSLQLLNQLILKASPEMKTEKTTSMTLLRHGIHEWADFPYENFGFNWKLASELPSSLSTFEGGLEHNLPEFKINPFQLISSLRMNLEARKIQIVENVSGFELTPEGCLTELQTIKCKQVVLALNGYLPQFHPELKKFITARRAQMLAVEFEGEVNSSYLHYDPAELVYWRKSAENILLIGGKRLLDAPKEVGDFDRLSPVIQKGLESYLSHELKLKFKVLHRWAGTMGFTENHLPLSQKVSAPLDTYVIGGFSGHGMGFGFHAAKEMAELVTGQRAETLFSALKKEVINL